jgi:hypothetical protein
MAGAGWRLVRLGWRDEPLPAFLHNLASCLCRRERFARCYLGGCLLDQPLDALWNKPEILDFRRRVRGFDSSPWTLSGGCDLPGEVTCLAFAVSLILHARLL